MIANIGKFFVLLSNIKLFCIASYYKSKYLDQMKSVGKDVKFNGLSKISGLRNITIGNNVHIGNNAYISGIGGLSIGDNTHISSNLTLYTNSHNYEGKLLPYDNTYHYKEVVIEKNVWIGINVTILPGTCIEEGCVIGAGAVVHGRIPKCTIFVASSGTNLKLRDLLHYEKLELEKMYGGVSGHEYSAK